MVEAATSLIRLGVNIDHVATLRNARGGSHPDPVRAAETAIAAGADGITAHLREDRRHIRDEDIYRLAEGIDRPLNLEMAATEEMGSLALKVGPHACCLVPERREEVTTEGGLDVAGQVDLLTAYVGRLVDGGIRVSLFIDPKPEQIDAARQVGAPVVELHTGGYCDAPAGPERDAAFARLAAAARHAGEVGLECHAGHGLTFDTVQPVAALPEVVELNIGHFLVGEAVFLGLERAVARMRALMTAARAGSSA